MADWKAMKTEYITQGTSYRALAKKYGVNATTIAGRGKAEGWVALREQKASETQAKILDAMEEKKVQRARRMQSVADKVMDRVEEMLDGEAPVTAKELKSLCSALRDVKELQMLRSSLDEKEQEAKIALLLKQAEKGTADGEIVVTLEGGIAEFGK